MNDAGLMTMGSLDRVFQIVFARYRREFGEDHIELAWRRACNTVWWFLAWPIAAMVFMLIAAVYVVTGRGTPMDHENYEVVCGAVGFLFASRLLRARFRKFLLNKPKLPAAESSLERRYVFWFRVVLNGGAALVAAMTYLAHETGIGFMHGF